MGPLRMLYMIALVEHPNRRKGGKGNFFKNILNKTYLAKSFGGGAVFASNPLGERINRLGGAANCECWDLGEASWNFGRSLEWRFGGSKLCWRDRGALGWLAFWRFPVRMG
ncbi:hypothetical protein Tco_1531858 [Tanacetum coccineum]